MDPELDRTTPFSRRRFLSASILGLGAALLSNCARTIGSDGETASDAGRIRARPRPDDRHADSSASFPGLEPGLHPLGLGGQRDGMLYVPPSYQPDRMTALLVGAMSRSMQSDEKRRHPVGLIARWNVEHPVAVTAEAEGMQAWLETRRAVRRVGMTIFGTGSRADAPSVGSRFAVAADGTGAIGQQRPSEPQNARREEAPAGEWCSTIELRVHISTQI